MSCEPRAESFVSGEGDACQALQDRALATGLVSHHNKLWKVDKVSSVASKDFVDLLEEGGIHELKRCSLHLDGPCLPEQRGVERANSDDMVLIVAEPLEGA